MINPQLTIHGSWYLLLQTALLVLHYGFKIVLPKWVLWFPTIFIGSFLSIVFFIVAIVLFISWLIS
jgi:hypothetical protein